MRWRDGRSERITFGRYPAVSLEEARRRAHYYAEGAEDPAPGLSGTCLQVAYDTSLSDFVRREAVEAFIAQGGDPAEALALFEACQRGEVEDPEFIVRVYILLMIPRELLTPALVVSLVTSFAEVEETSYVGLIGESSRP